jgi:very-short-patch-repair endonuclease
MAFDVSAVVGPQGWVTSEELLSRVSPRTVGSWVAGGKLVRLRPGVLALPSAAQGWRVRVAAALEGREAVASHTTALALWGLVSHPAGPVHVSVDSSRSARGFDGVLVHRAPGVYGERRRVDGLAVTAVERSVVDTWAQPSGLDRTLIRAVAIAAVRERRCAPRDLSFEVARRPRLAERAELSHLVSLLVDGCRSELEIWGCLKVLRAPGMPPFVQQRRVTVGGRTYFLDAAYDDVLLAVEMDGAAWHGSRAQREADIARDALMATIGWQTLRFSYARLTASPDACRREILAARQARLRIFRGHSVR